MVPMAPTGLEGAQAGLMATDVRYQAAPGVPVQLWTVHEVMTDRVRRNVGGIRTPGGLAGSPPGVIGMSGILSRLQLAGQGLQLRGRGDTLQRRTGLRTFPSPGRMRSSPSQRERTRSLRGRRRSTRYCSGTFCSRSRRGPARMRPCATAGLS